MSDVRAVSMTSAQFVGLIKALEAVEWMASANILRDAQTSDSVMQALDKIENTAHDALKAFREADKK